MNFDIKNYAQPVVDVTELASLGLGNVAVPEPAGLVGALTAALVLRRRRVQVD